ncbi:hypothetical protein FXO37_21461 [Capsicum annuum]|nr:hypothetical protein FXO37_21461 [Capsicum annuum]
MMDKKILLLLFFFYISLDLATIVSAQLQVGFYNTKARCPPAEIVVRDTMRNRFFVDHSITAALLRMYFHDCFVRTPKTQRTKGQKKIQEQIKSKLEATCSMTVSCADIIALATRDAVALAGGPSYNITTGDRLSRADSSMDTKLFNSLRKTCASGGDPSIFLDQNTYLHDASDKSTAGIVENFTSNPTAFQQELANALIKLAAKGALLLHKTVLKMGRKNVIPKQKDDTSGSSRKRRVAAVEKVSKRKKIQESVSESDSELKEISDYVDSSEDVAK